VVNRTVRPRLARAGREAIRQAPLPSRPVERGRPGPGLLARVLVAKYGDHLPPHRRSRIFAREGIDLDRSSLAGWVGRSTALLGPLAAAIGRHVPGGPAVFADDTPIELQAPGDGRTRTARVRAYVRDERPWLGPGPPAACHRFSVDRKGEHPADHLQGFRGWAHADGYAGFNELYRSGGVREVACLAHARRKLVEVFRAEGSVAAAEAPERIAGLCAVEEEGRRRSPDERVRLRQARARPIVDDLGSWLQARLPRISGESELAKATRHGRPGPHGEAPALPRPWPPGGGRRLRRESDEARGPGPEELSLRRLRGRRQVGRHRLHADRERQAQRRRPAGLAHRGGCWAGSPATGSPGSTSRCPGVTLPPQRDGRDAHRAGAA
jgi:transposase